MAERFRASFALQLRLLVGRVAPCVRGLAVGVLVVHLVDERRVEFGLEREVKQLAMVNPTTVSASRAVESRTISSHVQACGDCGWADPIELDVRGNWQILHGGAQLRGGILVLFKQNPLRRVDCALRW